MSRSAVTVVSPPARWELPHSVEAEQAVLGGLMLDPMAWDRVSDVLAHRDFFSANHGVIFKVIAGMVNSQKPVDVITVFDRLQQIGKKGEDFELPYLNAMSQSVPSASNIGYYAGIVRERANRRELIAAADQIRSAGYEAPHFDRALAQTQQLIANIAAASSPPPSAARSLDFRRLAGESVPAQSWFRGNWLHSGTTLLAGAGGEGKSSLAQHEPTCGALGRPYFAPQGLPYRSLVWNCEDDHDDMWRRQARICEHEQIDMSDLDGHLHLVSRYGCENALMAEVQRTLVTTNLFEELHQQVNDQQIDVLWLDNVAHLFLGNHDDRTHVTQFISLLNGLVRGRPFGVVLVAHVSRALGSEFTGSVAWENAARMRWYLGSKLPDAQRDDDEASSPETRFLAKRKSNYSARDVVRMSMRHGLLVPDQVAQSHVGGLVGAMDERRAEEVCLAGFRSLCGMGIRTTDGKTTGDYLPAQIVAKSLSCGYSKADLGKAMNRLMGRGEFARGVVGKHANRSDKFGLILNEGAA